MQGVCYEVELESKLQTLECEFFDHKSSRTEYEARFDIYASGLEVPIL